jgi:DNA ligase D-like protein (predicted polymerase)/DNA ligase D-like protein (predicted 3'-phosphoesterase)
VRSFRQVKFTNLQKILYPNLGLTKHQIIDYYVKVAPKMLVFLEDRPITLRRFPDGINKGGFWEKDAPKGKPPWIDTFRRYSETNQRDVEYIVCNNIETLAWLANLAALEINIPLHKTNSPQRPDLVLFDIDPEPPADFNHAIPVALLLKEKLALLGLKSYVKTSGQKGLHVVLPIEPKHTFKQTLAFVHTMGKILAKDSDVIVSEFRQSKIPGTVYVDYMQNIRFKTMVCPYSLRANEHATISTPLEWHEVRNGLQPAGFNIFNVLERKIDPWKGLFERKQKLDFENFEARGKKSQAERKTQTAIPLQEYAQKRDFTKTKEPNGRLIEEAGDIFVVQEHQSRRLHYDFRLARDGVLKSWAVPKGVPETPRTKRLAIATEDHPLEYRDFEGTIPKGEYGAGVVRIWDKGSYELKIWTDDKIEFFLKGGKLHGMYVLIKLKKTDTRPRTQNEWLIIKMMGVMHETSR